MPKANHANKTPSVGHGTKPLSVQNAMRVYPNTWMMIKPKTPDSMQMHASMKFRGEKVVRGKKKSNTCDRYSNCRAASWPAG